MYSISAEQVKTQSINRWSDIFASLAPHLSPMIERGIKHGPCSLCGGKDRARCHNDFAETGGIFCNQCKGGADGIATLRWANGWTFPQAIDAVSSYLGLAEVNGSNGPYSNSNSNTSKEEQFLSIYEKAERNSSLAHKYFESRGFNGGEFGDRELTDHGNSRRFVKQHGYEVRYVHSFGKFLIWNGKFWGKDEAGKVYHLATQTALSIYAEAAEHEDPKKQGEIVKHAKNSQAKSRLDAMVSLAKHQLAVCPDQLDASQFLLNVQNGTVNLKDGKLLAHNPDHLITKTSPIEYDPEATCPIWDRFLLEIMDGNQGMVEFLQRSVGYALTGSTSEQCLFLLYGVGRNGKSVFLEVLMSLLSDYGRKAEMKSFLEKKGDATNDIAALAGARFVSAVEIGRSKSFNESLIKEVTGQDQITARFLYQEFFTFTPSFKIFLATNAKPQIKGVDEGIWRRMKLIPFNVVIPKENVDKNLSEKLRGELPGILRWAVEGCLIWQQKGLEEPMAVTDATHSYRRESDHLADFFETICALAEPLGVPKWKLTVPAGILYSQYELYSELSGLECVRQRTFGVMMGERGLTAKVMFRDGYNSRIYSGLCLKEDLPADVDVGSAKHNERKEHGFGVTFPYKTSRIKNNLKNEFKALDTFSGRNLTENSISLEDNNGGGDFESGTPESGGEQTQSDEWEVSV